MVNLTLTASEAVDVLSFLRCARKGHAPMNCPACVRAMEAVHEARMTWGKS